SGAAVLIVLLLGVVIGLLMRGGGSGNGNGNAGSDANPSEANANANATPNVVSPNQRSTAAPSGVTQSEPTTTGPAFPHLEPNAPSVVFVLDRGQVMST